MEKTVSPFDRTRLAKAAAMWERGDFARAAGISEKRMTRLLRGETEFRQEEMLRIAALLRLDAAEADACFFTLKVQKF